MSEKRRLAFLCHPYHRGGVTRWMADAAVAAAAGGAEVYFVTVEPATEFVSAGGRERMLSLLAGGKSAVKVVSAKVGFTFEFGSEDYRASVYSDLVLAGVPRGVPIIVSDDPAVWCGAASIADKYPMIGVLHGDQDVYYNLAKKYMKQLSVCVGVSQRIRATTEKRNYDMEVKKLHTIPCGINLPDFAPNKKEDDSIHITFIGRLTDYEKRAEDLVLIGAMLHKQGVKYRLDIAGNSEDSKEDFTKRFREAGVAEYVAFHGWQAKESIQTLLNKTDVVLLTSNSEGMPLVMMEALASGCAFAGTRVSGVDDYEHRTDAKNCVGVYKVGDIAEGVEQIKRLAAVPVRERQAAARKLAEADFSMQVCLEHYFAALEAMGNSTATARNLRLSAMDKMKSNVRAVARYVKAKLGR